MTQDAISYEISYELESEGTKSSNQLGGLLELCKNSIIIPIDEIENSLHPDLYEHFLLSFLANRKNSPLIATTHQRELLMKRDLFRILASLTF